MTFDPKIDSTDAPPTLQYWDHRETPVIPAMDLAIACAMGFGVGGALLLITFLVSVVFINWTGSRGVSASIGSAEIGFSIFCFYRLHRSHKSAEGMSIDERRAFDRFLRLGGWFGFGLMSVVTGIALVLGSVSSF